MLLLTVCMSSILLNRSAIAQGIIRGEPNELAQPFSEAAVAKLDSLGYPWNRAAGHFYSASPVVKRRGIPDIAIQPCESWMRKALKPLFIPGNLDSLWHGIRMAPDVDLIVASYKIKQFEITWVDMQTDMALIVHDTTPNSIPPSDEEQAIATIKKTVGTFVNMPSGWQSSFRATASSKSVGQNLLWFGQAFDAEQVDEHSIRVSKTFWYSVCPFFIEGSTVYVHLEGAEDGKYRWNGNVPITSRLPGH